MIKKRCINKTQKTNILTQYDLPIKSDLISINNNNDNNDNDFNNDNNNTINTDCNKFIYNNKS